MIKKISLNNSRDYTIKLIELVKAGYEIDLTKTGTFYGRIYTIAYEDGIEETAAESVQSDIVVDEKAADSVSEDKVSEEAKEPVSQAEDNEAEKASSVAKHATAKKPVGRKASK